MKYLAIVKHGHRRYSIDEVTECGYIKRGFNAGKLKYFFVSQIAFWYKTEAAARAQFKLKDNERLINSVLIYSQI